MDVSKIKKTVVFIPALNEEAKIGAAIDEVRNLYPDDGAIQRGYTVELLVVNDGSTDKTENIALAKGVTVVSHPKNLGLGAATRTGMEAAWEGGADFAIKLDADLQHDPRDIEKVLAPLVMGKADICWGSRFRGSINYRMPPIRYIGNKLFTWLMNQVTDFEISDAQTGLMAFNRRYLGIFEIHGNYNPPQQLLIDASCKDMRYMEVPVTFNKRTTGSSFISLKYPFYVGINMFRMLALGNPLKVFSILGMLTILFSFVYGLLAVMAKENHWPITAYFVDNMSLVSLIIGVQLFLFGILADIIIRKRK